MCNNYNRDLLPLSLDILLRVIFEKIYPDEQCKLDKLVYGIKEKKLFKC